MLRQRGKVLTTPQLIKLGKFVSKAFRKYKGTAPEKTQRVTNGLVRNVNLYLVEDAEWMDGQLTQFLTQNNL